MTKSMSMQVLAVVLFLVLGMVFMKKNARFFLDFFVRMIVGMTMILGVNQVLIGQGIEISVGVNLISLLTSASLGIPGVALLFAILALQIL